MAGLLPDGPAPGQDPLHCARVLPTTPAMHYRDARPDDVPALAALGRDSFVAAFGPLYRPEDLAAFLAEAYDPAVVTAEMAGGTCHYQVAVDADGALVGYCKLRVPSKLAAHSDAAHPVELGQLYTAPGRTGEGIGAALMDWALGFARAGGHDAMQLSVFSENPGAQRFYARYGFNKTADITFRVGEHIDAEYLFEKRLQGE